MRNGYILLWRNSLESAIWKDAKLWRLWCWLLLSARWKCGKDLLGRQPVQLGPGEIVTSLDGLAACTGLSLKEVRSALALGKRIGALTTKGTPWGTRIGIVNWQEYQGPEAAGPRGQGKPKVVPAAVPRALPAAVRAAVRAAVPAASAGPDQGHDQGHTGGKPLLEEEGKAGTSTQNTAGPARAARAAAIHEGKSARPGAGAVCPPDANGSEPASRQNDCEQLLAAYPKKTWQDAARRWWRANEASVPPQEVLLRALGWHKQSETWKREAGRYIPTALNWLAGEHWRQAPAPRPKAAPPTAPKHCDFCNGEGFLRALPKPELGLPKHTATALFRCGLCKQHPDVGMPTVTPQELDRLGYTPQP